jgi:hypothetical protein
VSQFPSYPPSEPPPGGIAPGGQPPWAPPSSPPPGWGPPGPPPAPPASGRNKVGWIVLLLVGVLAVGAVGTFVLLDDGGDGSPEQTVRTVFAAIRDGDCETVIDLVTEDSWDLLASFADETVAPGDVSRAEAIDLCQTDLTEERLDTLDEVELISQNDERAVLNVTSTTDGEATTELLVLVREDGRWKLDFVASLEAEGQEEDPP